MKKFYITILSVFCLIFLALFTGGVSASFNYSRNAPDFADVSVSHFLSDNFTGGLFIDINQGERHNTLVQNILHGTSLNPNIGLDNPNSYLSRQIANRYSSGYSSTRIIGTADFWAESEMEKFLVNGAENMHFILHFPNGPGGDYYLYSTTVNVDNVNINSWINPVVKTTLRKNAAGIYEPVAAEQGRAKCSYYQQQYTGGVIIRAKSINYGSFQAL